MSRLKKTLLTLGILFSILLVLAGVYYQRSPTLKLMLNDALARSAPSKTYHREMKETPDGKKMLKVLKKGTDYMLSIQKNGTWENQHPGVTALCVKVLLESPLNLTTANTPALEKSIAFLKSLQQKNGSFYKSFSVSSALNNYNTSLIIMALVADDAKKHESVIKKAQSYLITIQQKDESEYEQGSNHGGVGYGGQGGADLSNLQLALEAMKESGLAEDHPFFKNAKKFVQRCQDSEGNDMEWAGGSGGFVYKPNAVDDKGEPRPYGAMTFAGIKSLLFCNVDPKDASVKDALRWIGKHYKIEKHPGKGQVSIYYYYYTLSKALSVAGIETLKLESGEERDWKKDLAKELFKRQASDGSWSNPNRKYLEGVQSLATAYALGALNHIVSAQPDA